MQRRLVELLALFGSTGHRHIFFIDDSERLLGMTSLSNLAAALGRATGPAA